ncbi:MAG TPA: 2-hydroxyacyl-CoA dehydratase [Candidatus Limadaptatus stercorigallinarum]|uniref:2-hydroxyacyl-CoA dehydratase n=1 Tax=Candidatus Limadaptatus stercorigallinarum TaxID=2840845 RepID=A0A9D1HSD1_9FIRM|nr:2-hydroxyacyl-CoA dehydratase [Candidatus Limadaptatus stercorigallinarum]
MKDLKHLIYFENLLQTAHNDAVKAAIDKGGLAVGYTCYFMPEVLLNVDNCFSVRLRAPRTGSMDIATYYMSSFLCGFSKALLERGIEGGYNFLSCLMGSETCSEMNRTLEHFEILKLVPNDKFFVTIIDAPFKITEHGLKHYVNQIRMKVLDRLHEVYGADVSDESLRKAVEMHNRVARVMRAIGDYRKEDNPRITGYEYHVLSVATYCCPKAEIIDKLEETLEELKTRVPDEKKKFRAKVVVVGSEMDDPDFTKQIEDAGALVVADRYCFGTMPGRDVIELNDTDDVLMQICLHYLKTSQCPRFMSQEKVQNRRDFVAGLVRDYHAEGVIYEQLKFCEYWGYERALASHIMQSDYNIPAVSIDRQYTASGSGQLRTRVQAFVESLEIKRIQKGKK